MQRYKIRRVSIRPLLRFGLVLGGGLVLPFGCLFALLAAKAISLFQRFLEGWQRAEYTLLGRTIHFDFLEILNLDGILQTLQALDQRLGLITVPVLLGIALVVGLVVALLVGLAGVGYNLFAGLLGGIELQLAEIESRSAISDGRPGGAREKAGRGPPAIGWLVPVRPDATGSSHPLRSAVTSIGSGGGNAVVLPFPDVAERHAEIRQEGDHCVLYDLGSAQGSYVNGRRTNLNLLKDGWVVRFGDREFVFRQ